MLNPKLSKQIFLFAKLHYQKILINLINQNATILFGQTSKMYIFLHNYHKSSTIIKFNIHDSFSLYFPIYNYCPCLDLGRLFL